MLYDNDGYDDDDDDADEYDDNDDENGFWVWQGHGLISYSPEGCFRGWGNNERYQRQYPINVLYDNDGDDEDDVDYDDDGGGDDDDGDDGDDGSGGVDE